MSPTLEVSVVDSFLPSRIASGRFRAHFKVSLDLKGPGGYDCSSPDSADACGCWDEVG